MDYLMTFLEGLLSFVSPCILPMVPLYITYLLGENNNEPYKKVEIETETEKESKAKVDKDSELNKERKKEIKDNSKRLYFNSLFFILGFTIVFMILGLFSSIVGAFLLKYKLYINIIFGIILIVFGLNFLNVFKINLLNKEKKLKGNIKTFNIISSFVFGLLFALSWTPCVGPFLASALMRAAGSGTVFNGVILLLLYALGIGIPFFLSAVFLAKLKTTFNFIKKHYKIINNISGAILIILGILKVLNLY